MKVILCLLLSSSMAFNCVGSESVLVAHHHDILLLQQNQSTVVVSAAQPVVAFDIHLSWRQLYWATDYYIYRTPLYDHNATTLLIATGRVGSLAVDWVHDRVYWTDLTAGRVEAARLDGRGRRVVYQTQNSLGALALDPQIGKLFWVGATAYEQRSIISINFDGSDIRYIYVNNTIYEHSPLALDIKYQSIYFYKTNVGYSELWQINYDGKEPYIKLFEVEEAPTRSLAMTDHGFYYSNDTGLVNATLRKERYTLVYGETADDFVVFDLLGFQVINEELKDATVIRVLEDAASPSWQYQCSYEPCQQECIPGGYNLVSCTCNYGYTLRPDQKTCSEDGYLIYSTDQMFGRINLDGSQHSILYNDSFALIQSFDVDVKSEYIFWSDLSLRCIYRAPVDNPVRKKAIIQDVDAYGVAVDWLHQNLYWTESREIMVSSLEGDKIIMLLNELDNPADIAVDPVSRYIFWVECGSSLSLRRAGLDGSDVRHIVDYVACSGTRLTVDPNNRTLYWLDWTGILRSCDYDGLRVTRYATHLVGSITVVDHHVRETPAEEVVGLHTAIPEKQESFRIMVDNFPRDIKVNTLKAVKSNLEDAPEDICEDYDCPGLCLPHQREMVSWCFCPDEDLTAITCSSTDTEQQQPNTTATNHPSNLTLLEATAVSLTVQFGGNLPIYPKKPFLHVNEISSLVPREGIPKLDRLVRVVNKTMPIKIESLNPATSYKISVRDSHKQEAVKLEAHTAPPPLEVKRLPCVTVPGVEGPISWLQQGVHYFSPNPWEDRLQKTLVLLLLSRKSYYQIDSPSVPQPLLEAMQNQVNNTFMIIKVYNSEEEFDDNPEVYLGNIPWGDEFQLATVQATEYHGSYTLDIVYSERFDLPDPYWDALVEDIMDDQIVMDKKLE